MKELTIPARILVVDDEPGLRKVLCNHLGHEGYKVVAVASGGAAVEMLSQDRFDLVITDLVMQGGDGYAVMEHIERQCPDTAVIVITAYGSLDSAIKAMKRGAVDYVQKPFELALMSLAVNRILERQRLTRKATHRAEQLSVLAEITQAINANLDIKEVYKTLAREAGRVVDFYCMTLSLLTSDGQHLEQRPLVCPSLTTGGTPLLTPVENSGEGWVIEQKRPFLASDVTQDERVAGWAVQPPPAVRSLIMVPLIVKDKAIGALSFGHSQPHTYAEDDLLIAERMAGQLATAIENARLLRQTQEQLEALQRTQAELIRSARLAAVGELARGLAHELNNPLSVVLGLTQFLQSHPDMPPKLSDDLGKVLNSAFRMAKLTRNFGEFAQPSSEGPCPVEVNVAVVQALELMHSHFSKCNITVEKVLASPPPLVFGYSHQIKQVLLKLLLNANEAIACTEPPTGGHRIVVETTLSSDSDSRDWVHIAISDTGGGIAPADLTRIFDPGYTTKVENGTVRGLGMGLYVSYGLAQTHGGTIDVESELGQGSRFIVRLPAETGKEGTVASDE